MGHGLVIASLSGGGMAMLGSLVLIGAVVWLVYVVKGRRRRDRDHTSDRNPGA